jgi:hypothetical protein
MNGTQVPYANTTKYLGMNLDAKLRWKEHIKKKRDELNIKFRKMYRLDAILSCQCIHKKTSWPLVRKRTIPTERPSLVGEI